ncbi:MAG: hypothetical protein AAGA97_07865 [Pseudomonadota bacterium]
MKTLKLEIRKPIAAVSFLTIAGMSEMPNDAPISKYTFLAALELCSVSARDRPEAVVGSN